MYKLGFCVYGAHCRYRHTRVPGPPPDPATLDAVRPRPRPGGWGDGSFIRRYASLSFNASHLAVRAVRSIADQGFVTATLQHPMRRLAERAVML